MAVKLAVDPALIDLFRAELEVHLPALNAGLLAMEKEAADPKRLEALMRAAHSIKGAAKIVGLDEAVQVAHVLEDCFVAAQENRLTITSDAVDVLLRGVDALQRLGLPQEGASEEISPEALRQLLDALKAVRTGTPPRAPASAPPAVVAAPAGPPTIRPDGNLDAAEAEAIRGRIASLLQQGASTIRLDLGNVRDLAPAGLTLLVRTARAAARRAPPATLQLTNARPEVLALLRWTHLDAAFAVVGEGA
ncbi:MAG TPA: Hpt domain-containing protein [Gemmataceae bacterium]|nr:Hpt domain-containing protein [Gemmataceae bacterium]